MPYFLITEAYRLPHKGILLGLMDPNLYLMTRVGYEQLVTLY